MNPLHQKSLVIAMHDHRPIAEDLPLMRAGGVTAKVYQIGVDVEIGRECAASAGKREGWVKRSLVGMMKAVRDVEEHPDMALLARSASDIERAKQTGKIAILLGVEGGNLLEGELSLLHAFHRLGLRELQLAWAFPNQLVQGERLTPFGKAGVMECAKLGLIVDVTHLPGPAFEEVMAITQRPVIVSHGAAKGVRTDLDDARIRAIARTGGVVGVHFYSAYLGTPPTLSALCDQIAYIAKLTGIEHVGLGVDFFPTTGVWRDFQLVQGTTDISWAIPDFGSMPLVTEELAQRGFRDSDIEKVLGLNFLRVCREVFGA